MDPKLTRMHPELKKAIDVLVSVKVFCPHNVAITDSTSDACLWEGPIDDLEKHIRMDCKFSHVRCPNDCWRLNKGKEVKLYNTRELRTHRFECPCKKFSCSSMLKQLFLKR